MSDLQPCEKTKIGRKNNSARARTTKAVGSYITHAPIAEDGFLTRDLVAIALRYDPNAGTYFHTLAQIAKAAERVSAWHRAREYWILAEECARKGKNSEHRRLATRAVSETYVQQAEDAANQPHVARLTAAMHIRHAIEVLRRGEGERERISELRKLLVEYQKGSTESFIPFSTSLDVGEYVDQAEAAVVGKPFLDAIEAIGGFATFLDVVQMRARAEDHAKRYLFLSMMPPVYLGDDGQVIDAPGSARSRDPNEREAALRAAMVNEAALQFRVIGDAMVNPARAQVLFDHPVREEYFLAKLRHNPLVPEGREALWAQGLYAGLVGDMSAAVHLLVPQLEHAIRRLVGSTGALVSGLDAAGHQMLYGLNTLLFEPKLREVLGENLTFTLQALLVDQVGPNLRNRMAHGLLTSWECYSGSAFYFWAFTLRFRFLPLQAAADADEAESPENGSHEVER